MVGVRFSSSGLSPASCCVGTDYASSGLERVMEGTCPPAEADHREAHRHLASSSLLLNFLPYCSHCSLWRASPTSHGLLRMCFLPKGLSWAFRGKRREISWFSQALHCSDSQGKELLTFGGGCCEGTFWGSPYTF